MKRRFAALGLSGALCFSLAAPAMATDQNVQEEAALEIQIQQEIEAKMEAAHDSLYEQLEAQDALVLLETFESIVYPGIEQSVRQAYGQAPITTNSSSISFYAPDGGQVYGYFPVLYNDPQFIYHLCLTGDDARSFFEDHKDRTFTYEDLVSEALGYIPYVGDFMSEIYDSLFDGSDRLYNEIADAGWNLQFIYVNNEQFGTQAAAYSAWETHPWITYDSDADVTCERF